MKDTHTILNEIIVAAKECGQVMLQADRNNFGIKDKAGKANFVTAYDCKIQEMLQIKLAQILPEAEFLGEEEDCRINREFYQGLSHELCIHWSDSKWEKVSGRGTQSLS